MVGGGVGFVLYDAIAVGGYFDDYGSGNWGFGIALGGNAVVSNVLGGFRRSAVPETRCRLAGGAGSTHRQRERHAGHPHRPRYAERIRDLASLMTVETSVEDRDLTHAIVAYLGKGRSPFPGTDEDAVAALVDGEDSAGLLTRVRGVTDEMKSIKIDWADKSLSEGGRATQQILAARHPELGSEALEALYWMFTYDWR